MDNGGINSPIIISSTSRLNVIKNNTICNVCNRTINQKSLKAHMLIHTGEKSHECNQCHSKFASKAAVNRHLLTHTKPHQCNLCGHKFAYVSYLSKHMLVHSDEKPYKCNHCPRTFRQKSILYQHTMTHADKTKSQLQNHMLTHTDDKLQKSNQDDNPFKCIQSKKSTEENQQQQKCESIRCDEKSITIANDEDKENLRLTTKENTVSNGIISLLPTNNSNFGIVNDLSHQQKLRQPLSKISINDSVISLEYCTNKQDSNFNSIPALDVSKESATSTTVQEESEGSLHQSLDNINDISSGTSASTPNIILESNKYELSPVSPVIDSSSVSVSDNINNKYNTNCFNSTINLSFASNDNISQYSDQQLSLSTQQQHNQSTNTSKSYAIMKENHYKINENQRQPENHQQHQQDKYFNQYQQHMNLHQNNQEIVQLKSQPLSTASDLPQSDLHHHHQQQNCNNFHRQHQSCPENVELLSHSDSTISHSPQLCNCHQHDQNQHYHLHHHQQVHQQCQCHQKMINLTPQVGPNILDSNQLNLQHNHQQDLHQHNLNYHHQHENYFYYQQQQQQYQQYQQYQNQQQMTELQPVVVDSFHADQLGLHLQQHHNHLSQYQQDQNQQKMFQLPVQVDSPTINLGRLDFYDTNQQQQQFNHLNQNLQNQQQYRSNHKMNDVSLESYPTTLHSAQLDSQYHHHHEQKQQQRQPLQYQYHQQMIELPQQTNLETIDLTELPEEQNNYPNQGHQQQHQHQANQSVCKLPLKADSNVMGLSLSEQRQQNMYINEYEKQEQQHNNYQKKIELPTQCAQLCVNHQYQLGQNQHYYFPDHQQTTATSK